LEEVMKKRIFLLYVLFMFHLMPVSGGDGSAGTPHRKDGGAVRNMTNLSVQEGGDARILARVRIEGGNVTLLDEKGSLLPENRAGSEVEPVSNVPEEIESRGSSPVPEGSPLLAVDLIVTNVSVIDASGPVISYQGTIQNQGATGGSGTIHNYIFLSYDTSIRMTDYQIDDWVVSGSLPAGGTLNSGTLYTTVSGVPAGNYYLGVWVDAEGDIPESNNNNNTGYDSSPRVNMPLAAPAGVNASDGVYLGYIWVHWSSVSDATHYRVYRNVVDDPGSSTPLGSWQTGTSYWDHAPGPGVRCYYWVKAAQSDAGANASPFSASDIGWRAIPSPTVSATDGEYTDRVRVTWNSVEGAATYQLIRNITSDVNGSINLVNWTTETSFDDNTAVPGTLYYYRVRGRNADGTLYSQFSPATTGYRKLSAPNVVASDGTYTDKILVEWNGVTGATHYRLSRSPTGSQSDRIELGSWQTGTSYHDTEATPGRTWYYWVRAAATSWGGRPSDYSYVDSGRRKLSPPGGVTATGAVNSVQVAWEEVWGALYYRVYWNSTNNPGSATALGSWQSGTTYMDSQGTPGVDRYYWVKAAVSDIGSWSSEFSSSAQSYPRLAPPGGVQASDGVHADRIAVSWNSVWGASHYRVYRNTSNSWSGAAAMGSWQSGLNYDDTGVAEGTTYYYWIVAAVNSSGHRSSNPSDSDSGFLFEQIEYPDISVDRTSLDFGSVSPGGYADMTLVVGNEGEADLQVSSTNITGTHASEFTVQSGGGSFVLGPGMTREMIVRFSPAGEGEKSANLNIESDDPDENPLGIGLTGRAMPAIVTAGASLGAGWNLFSINIDPVDPALENVMLPVLDGLVIMLDDEGHTYLPQYGTNTIGAIEFSEGYLAYMRERDYLTVEGHSVDPETPIPLPPGWSMIGYLPRDSVGVDTALVSITDSLLIAKNNGGQTYIPGYGINDLGAMEPGQGYLVCLLSPDTLIYPDIGGAAKSAPVPGSNGLAPPFPQYFVFPDTTGGNATVVIPSAANPRYSDGTGLESGGDEIGIFSHTGLCCGAIVWEGKNAALTAWGDDSQTPESDGFQNGDTLYFRVWKQSSGAEYEAFPVFLGGHPVVYETNGFSVLDSLVADVETDIDTETGMAIPAGFRLMQNYPNPFNPETTLEFTLDRMAEVELQILDLHGRVIRRFSQGRMPAGDHRIVWNGRSETGGLAASGIYLVRIVVQDTRSGVPLYTDVKRLILLK
jgi:hypothetical protein